MNFTHILRLGRHFDWPLMLAALGVLTMGMLALHSSTHGLPHAPDLGRQLLNLVPALVVFLVVIAYNYDWLRGITPILYWGNVLLLVAVMVVGHSALGAQRWINIGGFTLQPSELAKLAIIITTAHYLCKRKPKTLSDLAPVALHVGLPFVLVFKQPDLGTSLVFVAVVTGMLAVGGMNLKLMAALASPLLSCALFLINKPLWVVYLLGLGIYLFLNHRQWPSLVLWGSNGLAAGMVPLAWSVLKDYQKARIINLFNPESDPLGAGYHLSQSKIAIGSGGIWGKGLFHGTQTQLHFIPEQYTDFIFSVVGEEMGLMGAALLLVLYAIIIWRGLRIAVLAKDDFGCLIATGICCLFGFHIFVNIGMTTGILPVVGIPLPLMSYGGTQLMAGFTGIGLLQNIAMRRQRLMF